MKLDTRIAELVAIGASIGANCQPCLQYHVKKALKSGADEQEIADAIEIGKMVRKGAAANMDKFVASLSQAVPSADGKMEGRCGCTP
ncbi:MAG: carboxymuconolactone decarboxylase family protein [Anaerolineales bacterium]|nr:carboxymuconolactone decarboxylase family protein [Anaerolineales bacterium]NUQ85562.1 carboxymuconolactone decarboxylase family protein [Anaerolineales bacterium]